MSAPDEEEVVYLVLYQFKAKPVAARGSESGEELEDEGLVVGEKRKQASTKTYRKFNEAIGKSKSSRELRLKLPFGYFFDYMTTNPLGWMAHAGRCILGVSGEVADPSPDREYWDVGTRFVFTPDDPLDKSYVRLTNAADIAAIARRTQSVTQTAVHSKFSEQLLARDGGCVFTTTASRYTVGAHLIPFARQNAWLKEIDKRRGTGVLDINDPKNGLTVSLNVYQSIDSREAAILNLPNPDLEITDVAENENDNTRSGRQRPQGRRLVFQWLAPQPNDVLHAVPHNQDAAFKKPSSKKLPSPELLDYVYGASVLKSMGEVTEGYQRYQKLQEPRRPGPQPPKQRQFTPRTSAERSHRHHKRGGDGGGNDGNDTHGEGPSGGGSGAGRGGESSRRGRGGPRRGGKGAGGTGGGRKRAQGHHLGQEQDADGRVWRKLTDEEVDNWMALFRIDDDMLRELEEEKEHRAPHSIRNWSSQVSPGLQV